MKFLLLLLLASVANAADFNAPYPDQTSDPNYVVEATSWNFSTFRLEINNVWYLFSTVWTQQGPPVGGRTNYQSTLVYDSTGHVQAQVVSQLYQYYCGRSKCTVYEPLPYGTFTVTP